MNLKLLNERDEAAAATVAGLQNWRSLAEVIAEYAVMCPPDDDEFRIIVHKSLLADSYKSNPSTLAIQILGKIIHLGFEDCAGYQSPGKTLQITIILMRNGKPANKRRTNAKPSIKSLIKDFLEVEHPEGTAFQIPVGLIPPFLLTHPEQLTYQIKRETSTAIKIERNETSWTISRK